MSATEERDGTARTEARKKETVHDGYLTDYLRDEFLVDGFRDKPEWYHRAPEVVEQIIAPLLESSGATAEIFGSVPKCIATWVPEYFWDYGLYFAGEAKRLSTSGEPDEVVSIPRGLSTGATVDIDISIDSPNPAIFSDWFDAIRNTYRVSEDEVSRIPVETPDHSIVYGYRFEADSPIDDHLLVQIYSGPVPTNVKIPILVISILDKETRQRIFHADLVMPPQNAEIAFAEKRLAATSTKQDECVARLSTRGGRLWFEMTGHAVDVMNEADAILTESDDPASVMEVSLRALRMNVLHPVDDLYDLSAFMPQIRSNSLFPLREKMLRFLQERRQLSPTVLPLLEGELALCLTIDPYVTTQFLRDSGMALLIPGLRELSREDWDAILRSKQFVLEVPENRAASKIIRNWAFMERQRNFYRLGDNGKIEKQYDGVNRFIGALAEIRPTLFTEKEASSWALYKKLWVDANQDIEVATVGHSIVMPEHGEVVARVGTIYIYSVGNAAKRTVNLRAIAEKLLGAGHKEQTLERVLKRIRNIIRRHDEVVYFQNIIAQYDELNNRKAGSTGLDKAKSAEFNSLSGRYRSVALVYSILEEYPFGLTPREIKRLYDAQKTGFEKQEFRMVFLDLKLLGLVAREKTTRYQKGVSEPVSVDLYSLTKFGPSDIRVAAEKSTFIETYWNILEDEYGQDRPWNNSSVRGIVNSRASMLYRNDVYTMEALAALTEDDFTLLHRVTKSTSPRRSEILFEIAMPIIGTWNKIQEEEV